MAKLGADVKPALLRRAYLAAEEGRGELRRAKKEATKRAELVDTELQRSKLALATAEQARMRFFFNISEHADGERRGLVSI